MAKTTLLLSLPTTPRNGSSNTTPKPPSPPPSPSTSTSTSTAIPSAAPVDALLPTHVAHNLQQARAIAFHVSARRILRSYSFGHALRATRRLISSLHTLSSGVETTLISPPSISSISSTCPSASDSLHSSDSPSPSPSPSSCCKTTTPRRVDGLQQTPDTKRKRRRHQPSTLSSDIHDLAHKLALTRVSLTASRDRALRAMPGIPAAHDVFVLLSVFLSLPTTPGLNAVDGARAYNQQPLKLPLKQASMQCKHHSQHVDHLPRRASAPSLGTRPDIHTKEEEVSSVNEMKEEEEEKNRQGWSSFVTATTTGRKRKHFMSQQRHAADHSNVSSSHDNMMSSPQRYVHKLGGGNTPWRRAIGSS